MVARIKKKIKEISSKTSIFVKENLIQILLVFAVFIFLEISKSFPYVNLIPSVDFLIVGFTILLAVLVFRVTIPNKVIALVAIFLFVAAAFFTMVELMDIADMIGFMVYVLLSIMIIRQVLQEREDLKKIKN